ncbi:hypothetical protein PG997_006506 [Apiospora hydei]|uniref:3'-5' exonuclease domain-containing protein n=1 Tax=Apiospora hydei TaxID=1337664 RepID=A0ABR1WRJ6_9PEZI
MASKLSKVNVEAALSSISSLTAAIGRASLETGNPVIWVDTQKAMGNALDKMIALPRSPPLFFFDASNDSAALFCQYGIQLRGVMDLQLMELAAARSRGSRLIETGIVSGLATCIERDLDLSPAEKQTWAEGKKKGYALFCPDKGGDQQAFNQRPLAQELMDYCAADVRYLPGLWTVYNGRIAACWRPWLRSATESRIRESQIVTYSPRGRGKEDRRKRRVEREQAGIRKRKDRDHLNSL